MLSDRRFDLMSRCRLLFRRDAPFSCHSPACPACFCRKLAVTIQRIHDRVGEVGFGAAVHITADAHQLFSDKFESMLRSLRNLVASCVRDIGVRSCVVVRVVPLSYSHFVARIVVFGSGFVHDTAVDDIGDTLRCKVELARVGREAKNSVNILSALGYEKMLLAIPVPVVERIGELESRIRFVTTKFY